GMARWLSQQIALTHGVAAQLQFPLPARFVWDTFQSQFGELPSQSVFDRKIMHWRIFDLLPQLALQEEFAEPADYLNHDEDERKRYQLASKLSDLFDQYLVYRSDMLESWEKGEDKHWQAILWRQLCQTEEEHRAILLQKFRTLVNNNTLTPGKLPRRVAFFGISSLAPFYLEVINGISQLVEINLFCLNPCHAFWEDVTSQREMAKRRTSWRRKGVQDVSDYYEVGNPLLASLGTVGKEFNAMLEELVHNSGEAYEENDPTSLLANLQNDILNLEDRSTLDAEKLEWVANDHSLQFHICHSRVREIQVLHDQLLHLFEQDPSIKPADVLVMAPNIEEYSAAITGVFGAAPDKLHIPWSLADRHYGDEQPVVRAFLELLDLLFSRFSAPAVFAFLETPVVLRKFGLDEDNLQQLRILAEKSHIRWGLDAEQGQEFGLDPSGRNTWEFGLDRLFLGYLTGSGEEMFQGLTPLYEVNDSEVELLGTLSDILSLCRHYSTVMQNAQTPTQWSELLLQLLDDFFAPPEESEQHETMTQLRQNISSLAQDCQRAGFEQELSIRVVRDHLRSVVSQPTEGKAFLNGKVTFCNMVPMRSVPFRVIWLLGMNDLAYPRQQKPTSFDLMAQKPKLGDRNRRNDDRYLFLEALISTRDHFVISRVGLDQRDNSPLTPSVVVAELIDYLDRAVELPESTPLEKKPISKQLTITHPLQPFSPRCFDNKLPSASYASWWLPTGESDDKPFLEHPLTADGDEKMIADLASLAKFWCHPVRYFLLRRMGIDPHRHDESLAENEPFQLDNLEKYQLNEDMVARLSRQEDLESIRHRLHGTGFLPHGGFERNYFDDASQTTEELVKGLLPLIEKPSVPFGIDQKIGNFTLLGRLTNLYEQGRIIARATKFKATDLLSLWVHHLVLNLDRPKGVEPVSIHFATDRAVKLTPVTNPSVYLEELLNLYQTGRHEPLHFYPRTSLAWFLAKKDKKDAAIRKEWLPTKFKNIFIPGEGDDKAYEIALRGQEPFDTRFMKLAGIFEPIEQHLELYNPSS
ncbi:MAG: exodeoxyribonuclease V subunit gamma, partial [Desulfobulbaceae bacterium]|nr:exodeoxyribonuclease V subunit gamma [Desulfobulbaceae bacterium]